MDISCRNLVILKILSKCGKIYMSYSSKNPAFLAIVAPTKGKEGREWVMFAFYLFNFKNI